VKWLSFESTLVRVKRGLIPPDALELVPTQSRLEAPVHGGPVERSAVPATPSSRSFEADDRSKVGKQGIEGVGSKVSGTFEGPTGKQGALFVP